MRNKALFLILLWLLVPVKVQASTSTLATPRWTTEKARERLFASLPAPFEMRIFPGRDPNFEANQLALQSSQQTFAGRMLTRFNHGGYGVCEAGSSIDYYYDATGHLNFISHGTKGAYPRQSFRFRYPDGKLVSLSFEVSPVESYLFNPAGKLVAHWIGTQCFGAQGQRLITRHE